MPDYVATGHVAFVAAGTVAAGLSLWFLREAFTDGLFDGKPKRWTGRLLSLLVGILGGLLATMWLYWGFR